MDTNDTGFKNKLPQFVYLIYSHPGMIKFKFADRQKGFIASGIFLGIFSIIWNIFTLAMPMSFFLNVPFKFFWVTLVAFVPFILIGIFIFCLAAYTLFGKIEITFLEQSVIIFKGVANWGRRRQFKYSNISAVSVESSPIPNREKLYTYALHLTLVDDNDWKINFNTLQDAPYFFAKILNKIILQNANNE